MLYFASMSWNDQGLCLTLIVTAAFAMPSALLLFYLSSVRVKGSLPLARLFRPNHLATEPSSSSTKDGAEGIPKSFLRPETQCSTFSLPPLGTFIRRSMLRIGTDDFSYGIDRLKALRGLKDNFSLSNYFAKPTATDLAHFLPPDDVPLHHDPLVETLIFLMKIGFLLFLVLPVVSTLWVAVAAGTDTYLSGYANAVDPSGCKARSSDEFHCLRSPFCAWSPPTTDSNPTTSAITSNCNPVDVQGLYAISILNINPVDAVRNYILILGSYSYTLGYCFILIIAAKNMTAYARRVFRLQSRNALGYRTVLLRGIPERHCSSRAAFRKEYLSVESLVDSDPKSGKTFITVPGKFDVFPTTTSTPTKVDAVDSKATQNQPATTGDYLLNSTPEMIGDSNQVQQQVPFFSIQHAKAIVNYVLFPFVKLLQRVPNKKVPLSQSYLFDSLDELAFNSRHSTSAEAVDARSLTFLPTAENFYIRETTPKGYNTAKEEYAAASIALEEVAVAENRYHKALLDKRQAEEGQGKNSANHSVVQVVGDEPLSSAAKTAQITADERALPPMLKLTYTFPFSIRYVPAVAHFEDEVRRCGASLNAIMAHNKRRRFYKSNSGRSWRSTFGGGVSTTEKAGEDGHDNNTTSQQSEQDDARKDGGAGEPAPVLPAKESNRKSEITKSTKTPETDALGSSTSAMLLTDGEETEGEDDALNNSFDTGRSSSAGDKSKGKGTIVTPNGAVFVVFKNASAAAEYVELFNYRYGTYAGQRNRQEKCKLHAHDEDVTISELLFSQQRAILAGPPQEINRSSLGIGYYWGGLIFAMFVCALIILMLLWTAPVALLANLDALASLSITSESVRENIRALSEASKSLLQSWVPVLIVTLFRSVLDTVIQKAMKLSGSPHTEDTLGWNINLTFIFFFVTSVVLQATVQGSLAILNFESFTSKYFSSDFGENIKQLLVSTVCPQGGYWYATALLGIVSTWMEPVMVGALIVSAVLASRVTTQDQYDTIYKRHSPPIIRDYSSVMVLLGMGSLFHTTTPLLGIFVGLTLLMMFIASRNALFDIYLPKMEPTSQKLTRFANIRFAFRTMVVCYFISAIGLTVSLANGERSRYGSTVVSTLSSTEIAATVFSSFKDVLSFLLLIFIFFESSKWEPTEVAIRMWDRCSDLTSDASSPSSPASAPTGSPIVQIDSPMIVDSNERGDQAEEVPDDALVMILATRPSGANYDIATDGAVVQRIEDLRLQTLLQQMGDLRGVARRTGQVKVMGEAYGGGAEGAKGITSLAASATLGNDPRLAESTGSTRRINSLLRLRPAHGGPSENDPAAPRQWSEEEDDEENAIFMGNSRNTTRNNSPQSRFGSPKLSSSTAGVHRAAPMMMSNLDASLTLRKAESFRGSPSLLAVKRAEGDKPKPADGLVQNSEAIDDTTATAILLQKELRRGLRVSVTTKPTSECLDVPKDYASRHTTRNFVFVNPEKDIDRIHIDNNFRNPQKWNQSLIARYWHGDYLVNEETSLSPWKRRFIALLILIQPLTLAKLVFMP